ncbi:MAG: GntR family transcriptional regulator [Alkalilacustris sp.]
MDSKYALDRQDVTLSGRLVRRLREAILSGEFRPGQNLSERELCEMFAVSRGLVREAIQKLAAEDLITHVPHRGPQVALIGRAQARELYRVRGVLEGLACAEFTRNADDTERARLFEIMEGLRALDPDDPPEALVAAKNDFYDCLLAGGRNSVLAQMFTQLNNRIVQLRRFSLSQSGRLPVTLAEIGALVEAIRNRDAEAARRLAEAHVASAGQVADARFADLEQLETTKKEM